MSVEKQELITNDLISKNESNSENLLADSSEFVPSGFEQHISSQNLRDSKNALIDDFLNDAFSPVKKESQPSAFSIPKSLDKGYSPEPPIESGIKNSIEVISSSQKELSTPEPSQIEFLFGNIPSPQASTAPQKIEEQKSFFSFAPFNEASSTPTRELKHCSITSSEISEEKKETPPFTPLKSEHKEEDISALPQTRKRFSFLDTKPPVQTTLNDAPRRTPPLSAWQSIARVSIGMGIVSCVFALFTFILTNSESIASQFTESFISSAPIAAPGEISISETSYEKVALDNGEEVSIIKGKISNKGSETYKDLTIHGILFNKAGTEIEREAVKLSSPLASTRLKSLSIEMIDSLQKKGSSKRFDLSPNETAPFTIALLDPTAVKNAHSYITQIYSVKK